LWLWLLFGWVGHGRLDHCPRSGGMGVDRYMQYRNTLARAEGFITGVSKLCLRQFDFIL